MEMLSLSVNLAVLGLLSASRRVLSLGFSTTATGFTKGKSVSLFSVTESGWGGVSSLCFQAQPPSADAPSTVVSHTV